MNQLDPPPSSKPKHTWLWVFLVLFTLVSFSVTLVGIRLLKRSGIAMTSDRAAITPIDLNGFIDKSGSWNTGAEWQAVPRGQTVLGGVPFEINGPVRLIGRAARNDGKGYREEIKGIPVNRKFARLHLLHIVSYSISQETPYARITLRHADGSSTTWPLIYGQHGRDWHRPRYEYPSALGDPNSKVVWRGDYTGGRTLRLFKTTFTNPKPELEVTAIDLASENASPNATILSMSTGPANLPKPADDPPSLSEPEEVFDGQIQFTAVDAQDKPVPNLRLQISGSETSGNFRTPDAVTDAKGQCLVRHPGDSTRSITLAVSGDGIAARMIRWGQRTGEIIPLQYTFHAEKAVTIGGKIVDETGQPVSNAKLILSAILPPDQRASLNQPVIPQTTLTNDAQGRWEFRSFPENFSSLNVIVNHPDYLEARYLGDGVDRAYNGERVKLATLLKSEAVFQLRKGLVVTGRVLTDQGEPIAGARLLLGDSRFASSPKQARTDEQGEFRLPGGAEGSTYLTVQANGRAPESRPITVAAGMKPAVFKLAPGRALKVRVIDESGKPVRTARISVDMWDNRQVLDLSGTTDANGRLTLLSAPASGLSGSASKAGYMSSGQIQFATDGEEQVLTLRRSVTITGTVVDAVTKESIPRFDVTRGMAMGAGEHHWLTYDTTKGVNGSFSVKLDQQNITALQIEADDHEPAIISLTTNTETHFDIELKKGSGPKGFVHTAEGKPAVGAQVATVVRGKMIQVGASKLMSYGGEPSSKPAVTSTNGAFTLRFVQGSDRLIAVHPQGYAELPFSNFVENSTITLQPWGHIEGVLKIGTRPGTNESVLLSGDGGIQFNFQDFKATTDEQGRFTLTNVPPGERKLVRLVSLGAGSWGHSHMQNVLVKTGEVTTVTMGGNGRAVIGKLALSDATRTIDWPQSGHHSLSCYPKPPPFNGMEGFRAWENQPETLAARKNARSYTLMVQEDGSFRIDDVLAGTYDLRISLIEGGLGRRTQNSIGTLTTNVMVPTISDPTKEPPLDLGTLVIPLREPQRNAALR